MFVRISLALLALGAVEAASNESAIGSSVLRGKSKPQAICSNGFPGIDGSNNDGDNVCCPLECNQCGGMGCASNGDPGFDNTFCCPNGIIAHQEDCTVTLSAPCVITDGTPAPAPVAPSTPAPVDGGLTCSNGLPGIDGSNTAGIEVCCPVECNQCGGAGCGSNGDPGFDNTFCCPNGVIAHQEGCTVTLSAPCVITLLPDDDITVDSFENCDGFAEGIGNGFCNIQNNNEQCGYDGGDCCSCTCVPPEPSYDDYTTSEACTGVFGGFACIDPSAPCVDDDDITVDVVQNCDNVLAIGDGSCDSENNNALCAFDGGDCCSCTCVPNNIRDDDFFGCNFFACIDPSALCVDDDDITIDIVENCSALSVGNGYCDEENNKAECNYDGGDCCSCTCESQANQECGTDGFACIDPAAPCVDDDDITIDLFDQCFVGGIGNGRCDQENNKPECNYDGGDCCSCTCESGLYNDCGVSGFACIDPTSGCADDDDITAEMIALCFPGGFSGLGNGRCEAEYNTPECNYDGGDCCSCTCESGEFHECGGSDFACIDPSASCVGDDDITVDLVENCEDAGRIGDGYCNAGNNNEICGYDAGDCCSCTCVEPEVPDDYTFESDSQACGSQGFLCIDPSALCVDDDDITADLVLNCEDVFGIGDGLCIPGNNNEGCGYDGGDCCSCTCVEPEGTGQICGLLGFACIDPMAECFDGGST